MVVRTGNVYLAKEKFNSLLSTLRQYGQRLSISQKIDLSLEAYELYKKGMPYSLRPFALYYFYHLLPLEIIDNEENVDTEKWKTLLHQAGLSLSDDEIRKYLVLLDADKYYEVFQKRGDIMIKVSGLDDYLDLSPEYEWEQIQDRVLPFIEKEPFYTLGLIEKMLFGLSKYYYDNSVKNSVRFRIAQMVWEFSTDRNYLKSAWLILNNPEDVHEYEKSMLNYEECQKLLHLEKLEKEILRVFDEGSQNKSRYNVLMRLRMNDLYLAWLHEINSKTGRGNTDEYVKGYSEFLRGYVCYSTGHLKRAEKEFIEAYKHHYNHVIVLMYLVKLLEGQHKYKEASGYACEVVRKIGVSAEDISKEECFSSIEYVFSHTKMTSIKPDFIINNKAEENKLRRSAIFDAIKKRPEINRKRDLEERIAQGCILFDELAEMKETDLIYLNPELIEEINIEAPLSEIEQLGLDEIEIFESLAEECYDCSSFEVSLWTLLNFNARLIERRYRYGYADASQIIKEFPNSLSAPLVVKHIVSTLVNSGDVNGAVLVVNNLIRSRSSTKIQGLYEITGPVRIAFHNTGSFHEEVSFISGIRNHLTDEDLVNADADLAEAFEKYLSKTEKTKEKKSIVKIIVPQLSNDIKVKALASQAVLDEQQHRNAVYLLSGFLILFVVIMIVILSM